MASPLSQDLIAGAIGESGALIAPTLRSGAARRWRRRPASEFAKRARRARRSRRCARCRREQILEAAAKLPVGAVRGDGRRLVPAEVAGRDIRRGRAGARAAARRLELRGATTRGRCSGQTEPTPENYRRRRSSGCTANGPTRVLKLYPASTREEVMQAATDLASDRFIAYSTWKWFDLHGRTGGKPVYRYLLCAAAAATANAAVPAAASGSNAPRRPAARGAVAFRRDRVRDGQPRTEQGLRVDAGRSQGVGGDAGIFRELRQDRQSERRPGLPKWPAANSGAPRSSCASTSSRARNPTRRARAMCSSTQSTTSRSRPSWV